MKAVIMFYVDAPPFVHPTEDKLGAKDVVEITFITFSKHFLLSVLFIFRCKNLYFMCFPFQIKPIVTKNRFRLLSLKCGNINILFSCTKSLVFTKVFSGRNFSFQEIRNDKSFSHQHRVLQYSQVWVNLVCVYFVKKSYFNLTLTHFNFGHTQSLFCEPRPMIWLYDTGTLLNFYGTRVRSLAMLVTN